MPTLDAAARSKGVALLDAHWKPQAIAEKLHCHHTTVRRWEHRLQMYGSLKPPRPSRTGRPRRIHTAATESLLQYLRQFPLAQQDELAAHLKESWGITVNQSTISRLLKKHGITHKHGQRVVQPPSQPVRTAGETNGDAAPHPTNPIDVGASSTQPTHRIPQSSITSEDCSCILCLSRKFKLRCLRDDSHSKDKERRYVAESGLCDTTTATTISNTPILNPSLYLRQSEIRSSHRRRSF